MFSLDAVRGCVFGCIADRVFVALWFISRIGCAVVNWVWIIWELGVNDANNYLLRKFRDNYRSVMWCFDHQWESCRRDEPSIVLVVLLGTSSLGAPWMDSRGRST